MRFAIEDTNTETSNNYRQFLYLYFKLPNAKKHGFAMENMSNKTAYNCKQLPYLNFKWRNAEKTRILQRKTGIGKQPTNEGSFRI